MARRVLSAAALCACLLASACKHDHPTPAPPAAPADSVTVSAQETRFDSELKRARARWQELPGLGNCTDILPEKADQELCRAASGALGKIEEQDPAAPPDTVLPALADASLALVRLVERARFLSLEDLGRRKLEGDAGAPSPSASSARTAPPGGSATRATAATPMNGPHGVRSLLRDRLKLKLSESPLSRLVQTSARLERDVLRNLAAYLEYAPLPIRQSAFAVVKKLQAQHSQWPALNRTLREASVLEANAALKQSLTDAAAVGLPPSKPPDQPTGSK